MIGSGICLEFEVVVVILFFVLFVIVIWLMWLGFVLIDMNFEFFFFVNCLFELDLFVIEFIFLLDIVCYYIFELSC